MTPTDERTRSYLKAIVQFGQSLGLRVVAEGVEDAPTLAYLREPACDVAQDYHIGKPLPASQIHDWLPHNTGGRPAPTRGAPIAA